MQTVLVVNTAAVSTDLTILATVKAECGILDTSEDSNIAVWIKQASAACAAYCNRVFGKETVTETMRNRFSYIDRNANKVDQILLARSPVIAITSITQDGTALVLDTDYWLDAEAGIIYRIDGNDNSIPWSFAKLIINYAAGYDLVNSLVSLPRSIERACISHVKALRSSADRDPNVKQESIPGVLETAYWIGGPPGSTTGALSTEVTGLLDPYRNVSI